MLQCSYTDCMLQQYRFIVTRARSLRTCPTVHLSTCPLAKRITKPIHAFFAEGLNAHAALASWKAGRPSLAVPYELCRTCLNGAS